MLYSSHFHSARVAISANRGWRLRAPDSSVRKARYLYTRIVRRGQPAPRDGKERTGSGAGSESGAGTETGAELGAGTETGAGTRTGVEVNEKTQDENGDGSGDGVGAGTGVEARGRTQDGNEDMSGDRKERSSGDGNGDVFKTYFLSEKTYLKYMDFSTTYQFSYQERLIISSARRNRKNKVVHGVYPSLAKIEGTTNAPALVQQFTHLVHPDRSYRLSYLLRQFADKTEKYTIESRQNTRGKTTSKQYMRQIFLFSEKYWSYCDRPRSNCLFGSVVQAVVTCCCCFFVRLANSSRTAACCEVTVVSFSSSTLTSG